ncbi:MAG: MMPL family transporter [Microthrixaceae bacterium]
MFSRLGSWCFRKRRAVVAIWLVVLIGGAGIVSAVGSGYSTDFSLPDVESRHGFDILESQMGGLGAGIPGEIVFRSESGFDEPAVRSEVDAFLNKVAKVKHVTVQGPFDSTIPDASSPLVQWLISGTSDPTELTRLSGGDERIATTGPEAGKVAYASISISRDIDMDQAMKTGTKIMEMAPKLDGVQIAFGGDPFQEFEAPSSELLGLSFAIIILIAAFGSVLAMGLPIGVAMAGIGVGSIALTLMSNFITMPDFATTLGVMIGLGVGIDYALFIVTRYREQLREGHTVEEAIAIAIDTSGRAVTFAGFTVVISLLGMLIMGVSFVSGLGIGAATIVMVTMVASLTLLPALLGFAGERVNVTRYRGLIAAGLVSLALFGAGLKIQPLLVALPLALIVLVTGFAVAPLNKRIPARPPKPLREGGAYRWSRFVQSNPWPLAIGATLVLLALTIPLFGIRLGFSDAGNLPENNTGRKAYDLMGQGFGAGSTGKLMLVSTIPEGVDATTSKPYLAISKALLEVPGIASVGPPIPSNMEDPAASKALLWTVVPTTSPQDEATTELVHHLRSDVLPKLGDQAGLDILVTGQVAVSVDFSEYLAGRLFFFFAAVLALSFLLLMLVFRSLLVPLKAVLMNLLSIGAAYGVLVAIFQWGWLKTVFGVEPAPIEPFMPMMLFAIVFGLSMDYEVFLLSRIREEWLRTGDSKTSVADGLAATARVITAAAAIMVFVFGSFLLEGMRVVKLMGFGLAFAVLLDATVVRMLLVPATMELLGDRNWWIPKWLNRLLPNINVEGPVDIEAELAAEGVLLGGHGLDSDDPTRSAESPDSEPVGT